MSAMAQQVDKKRSLQHEIAEVEARLHSRWADTRVHAAVVGSQAREKVTSPYTLIGAVGLGFGIAWYYQQRQARPEREERPGERRDDEQNTSKMSTLLSVLNLAGMVIALFPKQADAGQSTAENDPR